MEEYFTVKMRGGAGVLRVKANTYWVSEGAVHFNKENTSKPFFSIPADMVSHVIREKFSTVDDVEHAPDYEPENTSFEEFQRRDNRVGSYGPGLVAEDDDGKVGECQHCQFDKIPCSRRTVKEYDCPKLREAPLSNDKLTRLAERMQDDPGTTPRKDNVKWVDTIWNMTPEQVLNVSLDHDLARVVVMGFNKDDEMYITASDMTCADALWIIEYGLKKFWKSIFKS